MLSHFARTRSRWSCDALPLAFWAMLVKLAAALLVSQGCSVTTLRTHDPPQRFFFFLVCGVRILFAILWLLSVISANIKRLSRSSWVVLAFCGVSILTRTVLYTWFCTPMLWRVLFYAPTHELVQQTQHTFDTKAAFVPWMPTSTGLLVLQYNFTIPWHSLPFLNCGGQKPNLAWPTTSNLWPIMCELKVLYYDKEHRLCRLIYQFINKIMQLFAVPWMRHWSHLN